jgi:hypothetical protein
MTTDATGMTQAVASAATAVESTSGLRWSDIVALVGAAAWLPQLWRFFQRPKVTPIAGGQIELGFNNLGPLFNPKIAFRAERRAALVTGIEFRVLHERGQSTDFKCNQLVEYGAWSESTSGEKAVHQRLQDVVAVVIGPMSIVERKTNSREVNCLRQLEVLSIGLATAIDRLRSIEDPAWIDNLLRSREYVDTVKFLEDSFTWQAGKYKVECSVSVAGQAQPSKCKFQFVLGDSSLVLLKSNVRIMKDNFRRGLEPADATNPQKPPEFNWIYANVLVDDSNN